MPYFNRNPKEFLRRFVTIDEIWIYHYIPESHERSKQWVKPGENTSKRPKTQQSAGKIMASVFRYAHTMTNLRKERQLLQHIMLNSWIDCFTKSGRNGHI